MPGSGGAHPDLRALDGDVPGLATASAIGGAPAGGDANGRQTGSTGPDLGPRCPDPVAARHGLRRYEERRRVWAAPVCSQVLVRWRHVNGAGVGGGARYRDVVRWRLEDGAGSLKWRDFDASARGDATVAPMLLAVRRWRWCQCGVPPARVVVHAMTAC